MSLLNDFRYGIRSLLKSPGYASVAVLTLALAIGANTVIFSFANVLLLQPLPLANPERIAFVYSVDPHSSPRGRVSFADYQDFRDRSRSFSSLAAWTDDNRQESAGRIAGCADAPAIWPQGSSMRASR